jgi:hypothetical protein
MKYTEELENKIRVTPSPPDKTKLYTKVDLLLQSTQLIGTEVFMTLSTEHIIFVVMSFKVFEGFFTVTMVKENFDQNL